MNVEFFFRFIMCFHIVLVNKKRSPLLSNIKIDIILINNWYNNNNYYFIRK